MGTTASAPSPVRLTYGADMIRLFVSAFAFLFTIGVVWQWLMPRFPISLSSSLGGLAFMTTCIAAFILVQRSVSALAYRIARRSVQLDENGITLGKSMMHWSEIVRIQTGPLMGDGRGASLSAEGVVNAVASEATDNWIVRLVSNQGLEMDLLGSGFRNARKAEAALRDHLKAQMDLELPPRLDESFVHEPKGETVPDAHPLAAPVI